MVSEIDIDQTLEKSISAMTADEMLKPALYLFSNHSAGVEKSEKLAKRMKQKFDFHQRRT